MHPCSDMDHISIPIADVLHTKAFYESALRPLGWQCSGFREGVFVGFKKSGSAALYFNVAERIAPVHLAFKADSRDEVVDFHQLGLNAGGTENGAPGPRPAYGPEYFAAFVLDPDGHNVEAVLGGVG